MVPQWHWFLLFVLVLVLTLILRSAWFKGKLGEFKVNVGVSLLLDRNVYRLIKNVTLMDAPAKGSLTADGFLNAGVLVPCHNLRISTSTQYWNGQDDLGRLKSCPSKDWLISVIYYRWNFTKR
jgi:hypothetical protein